MKILFFANTDWYLYNFRLAFARFLRSQGMDVIMVSPPGPYGCRLMREGFRWVTVPMYRRSLNPLREVRVLWRLWRLYMRENPELIHNFTLKCVIYSSLVARLAQVGATVNAVAGLGYVFTSQDQLARRLRPMVSRLLGFAIVSPRSRVIVQNPDDRSSLTHSFSVRTERMHTIRSSGVDTTRFHPRSSEGSRDRPFRVLLAARLLRDKGIVEYANAARQLKGEGLGISFLLAGATDPGNPASISAEQIAAWQSEKILDVLGHADEMETLLREVDVVVLPSYREGVPRVLLEAASCGLPIVTTDSPGCREAVEDGTNGMLIPVRDSVALADSIRFLYERPDERLRMGKAGRLKVLTEFDERIVFEKTWAVYRELIPSLPRLPVWASGGDLEPRVAR